MIKLEKGVPLPPITRNYRKSKYPFELAVAPKDGVLDSFFVPDATVSAVQSAAARFMRSEKGLGKKFTVRHRVEDGIPGARVWRTQ